MLNVNNMHGISGTRILQYYYVFMCTQLILIPQYYYFNRMPIVILNILKQNLSNTTVYSRTNEGQSKSSSPDLKLKS